MRHWIEDIPIIALDFETTGLDPLRCSPVSIGALRRGGDGLEPVRGVPYRVRPDTPVEPGAERVHGISAREAQRGVPLAASLSALLDAMRRVQEAGGMVVGANLSYDLTVLLYAGHRCGLPNVDAVVRGAHVLDAMVLDRGWDTLRSGPRSLHALCRTYGVPLLRAHEARADAEGAWGVCRALLRRSLLSEGRLQGLAEGAPGRRWRELRAAHSPDALHRLQERWWAEDLEELRRRRRSRGIPFVGARAWPVEPWREVVDDGWRYADRWGSGAGAAHGEELREEIARAFEEGRAAGRAQERAEREEAGA